MSVPTPDDVGLAACGNLAALRRLRDYWLDLAGDNLTFPTVSADQPATPRIPKEEALAQLELLAEMAARATNQSEDWLVLLASYQLRVARLESVLRGSEGLAKQAVEADDVEAVDRWTRSVVEFGERLAHYRSQRDAVIAMILNSEGVEGVAMLVAALTARADRGDDLAVTHLQWLMDSVTPERAAAIQSDIRRMEGVSLQ